eukprot:RCo004468
MAEDTIHRDATRATKFQKKFVLPPNFSEVLKGFTREVLREQPEDINAFGASYFKRLALQQEGIEEVAPKSEASSRKQLPLAEREKVGKLQTQLLDALSETDYDKVHRLHSNVIKRVLRASLQFSGDQCSYLISCVGDNINLADGTIDYERFVIENILLIHFFTTSSYVFKAPKHRFEETVHGLTRDELVGRLTSLLQAADTAGTGKLTLEQYNTALRHAQLQLTHRDIALLTAEAMVSADGSVQYADELRRAFGLLLSSLMFEKFATEWAEGKL